MTLSFIFIFILTSISAFTDESAITTTHCDYYTHRSYIASPANNITMISVRDNAFEMQFVIKLNSYCSNSICNILYIGNTETIPFASLSIDGINNYFKIIHQKDQLQDIYTISNADKILPVDNNYHIIYLKLTSHNKIFKIDNITYYNFQTTYSDTTQTISDNEYKLPLYISSPWEESINGSLSNICISTPIKYGNCNECVAEIKCNEEHYGFVSQSITYYFPMLSDASVTFYIYWYDQIYIKNHASYLAKLSLTEIGCHTNDTCIQREISKFTSKPSMTQVNSLPQGEYKASISNYVGNFVLQVICKSENDSNNQISKYALIPVQSEIEYMFQAEKFCEYKYHTTLATINSEEDMNQVVEFLRDNLIPEGYIWIGLYKGRATHYEWNWVDGTICEFESCIDDKYWFMNQSLSKPKVTDPIGTYLHYQYQTDQISVYATEYTIVKGTNRMSKPSHGLWWALCNAPNMNDPPTCDPDINDCWIRTDCCNDSVLNSDELKRWVLFYNSTVFFFGNQIHYAKFDLGTSSESIIWNHIDYPHMDNETDWYVPLVESVSGQYYSSLYWMSFDSDYVIHLNVENVTMQSYKISHPLWISEIADDSVRCIIPVEDYLYLVTSISIWIFDIKNEIWSKSSNFNIPSSKQGSNKGHSMPGTCGISNNIRYIYIFGYYYVNNVFRYDIMKDSFKGLDTQNLCYAGQGTGVSAPNNKVYLQNCYVTPWKSLIFNMNTEQFETHTMDFDVVDLSSLYYRTAGTSVSDDNVLAMHVQRIKSNDKLKLFFAIIDDVSINFKGTASTIWPSNGFIIKYFVNDFNYNDNTSNIYDINVHTSDTYTRLDVATRLNTFNDGCICRDISYKCYNCKKHFDLQSYLSVTNDEKSTLHFRFESINPTALIRWQYATIKLKRCIISFDISQVATSKNPTILFTFSLSELCHSRIGSNFSLDITAKSLNVSQQMMFKIGNNRTINCRVCNKIQLQQNCISCSNGKFIIDPDIREFNQTQIDIYIEPHSVDLQVQSRNHSIQYFETETTEKTFQKWDLLSLLIIPICVIILIVSCIRNQYKKVFVVNNALVLLIGVSQFNDKTLFLPGVRQCIDDLKQLWRIKYNFKVFICNKETLYATKQDIIDFIDFHLKKLKPSHNAIIVHILSHGNQGVFKSSDDQMVEIDFFIHELETKCEEIKNMQLLKIIWNHFCQGTENYSRESISLDDHQIKSSNVVEMSLRYRGSRKRQITADKVSPRSNFAIITGNVPGRTMSDSGNFSKCIYNAFSSNLSRWVKWDWNALITDIRDNLQQKTKTSEILTVQENICFNTFRIEPNKQESIMKINANKNEDWADCYILLD